MDMDSSQLVAAYITAEAEFAHARRLTAEAAEKRRQALEQGVAALGTQAAVAQHLNISTAAVSKALNPKSKKGNGSSASSRDIDIELYDVYIGLLEQRAVTAGLTEQAVDTSLTEEERATAMADLEVTARGLRRALRRLADAAERELAGAEERRDSYAEGDYSADAIAADEECRALSGLASGLGAHSLRALGRERHWRYQQQPAD